MWKIDKNGDDDSCDDNDDDVGCDEDEITEVDRSSSSSWKMGKIDMIDRSRSRSIDQMTTVLQFCYIHFIIIISDLFFVLNLYRWLL